MLVLVISTQIIFGKPLTTLAAVEDGDGAILPTWTAVDTNNVKTSRELWEHMRDEGWHVEVLSALNWPYH